MKIFKPLNQSLLYKSFEADRSFYLCTAVISFFSFESSPVLLSDPDLWKFLSPELGKDAILDMCMPKPRGEVLVTGRCYASEGKDSAGEVSLKTGPIDKTLYVFGDRFWQYENPLIQSISDPLHFTEIDISYDNAFGGPEFEKNPLGKGAAPVEIDTGELIQPLPNIEMPETLIGSPDDRPDPAGFGPIDLTWPQRMEKVGTYDQKWLEELFPGLAADMDPTFFNVAPEDQWSDGFFNGDELFEIKGMHPEKKILSSKLPGIKSRCFINQKTEEGEVFKEIKTNLDTVWLFPHAERGIIIWRGVTEIQTDDAEDILHMLVAYERVKDEPKSF
jgi:hypothetical protein